LQFGHFWRLSNKSQAKPPPAKTPFIRLFGRAL
jgi:hypothetical protein